MRDRSRHFSMFRSGLCIGLSLPALISGIYESKLSLFMRISYQHRLGSQGHTMAAIPAWSALLQVSVG